MKNTTKTNGSSKAKSNEADLEGVLTMLTGIEEQLDTIVAGFLYAVGDEGSLDLDELYGRVSRAASFIKLSIASVRDNLDPSGDELEKQEQAEQDGGAQ
jgi:hypothetical protein